MTVILLEMSVHPSMPFVNMLRFAMGSFASSILISTMSYRTSSTFIYVEHHSHCVECLHVDHLRYNFKRRNLQTMEELQHYKLSLYLLEM